MIFISGAIFVAAGEQLPTDGVDGFLGRLLVVALYPVVLWFVALNREERAVP